MTPKNEKFEEIKKYLIGRDKKLSVLFESFEIAEKKKSFSNFQNLIRIIVGQQLSGAAAKMIFSRLLGLVGNNFSPTAITKLSAVIVVSLPFLSTALTVLGSVNVANALKYLTDSDMSSAR